MKIYRQINSNFHGDVAYVEQDLEPPKPVGFLCCGVFYEMGDIDEFCDREHTLLFTHPTTERRVIPEDVRVVMEMAMAALKQPLGFTSSREIDAILQSAITALRNALNAAPKGEV
mgnify:CR=1 FL=1